MVARMWTSVCLGLVLMLSCHRAYARKQDVDFLFNSLATHGPKFGGRKLQAPAPLSDDSQLHTDSQPTTRKLHAARSPQKFRARVGAAVLSKVSNCPGIKPSDVAKLVARTRLTARIGAIPRAPTPEAARFAGQTITMYIAPKALTAKRQQEVLGPIARGLSKLAYCPFEGDYVLKLEATLLTVELLDKKRQLTATDKKIIKCLTKIKVTLRAGHIEKINTAAATKAGTLVVPYIVAA